MTNFFFKTGLLKVLGGGIGATVEIYQSVWNIRKPKVSTSQMCMAVLGWPRLSWSCRTVMGPRLVKKMRSFFVKTRLLKVLGGG